jgi:hypothetical protein
MKRPLFFTIIIFSLLPAFFGESEKTMAGMKASRDETAELQKKITQEPE